MSFKKTLSLALLLAIVGVYIYLVEIPHQQEVQKKGLVFIDLTSAEIKNIEIKKDDATIMLHNTSPHAVLAEEQVPAMLSASNDDFKTWELSNVKGSSLDKASLSSLLTSLRQLKLQDPIPAEDVDKDLSVYGLSKPALTISVKTMFTSTSMTLGKSNSYLNKRYLKVDNEQEIYLIPEALYSAAAKKEDDFRNRTPIDFMDNEVKKVKVQSAKNALELDLDADKKWLITSSNRALASATSISELFRSLRNAKAKDFINDTSKLSEYKLDNPEVKISLEFLESASRQPVEISYSKIFKEEKDKNETLYYGFVSGSPSIFSIATDPIAALTKSVDNYREKFLFRFATNQVQKVISEDQSGTKLDIVHAGPTWKVNYKDGDKIFVEQFLSNLLQLEARTFPSESRDYGFSKPILKVLVSAADGPSGKVVDRTLLIGAATELEKGEKGYFASTDDGKYVFTISEGSFKKIALKEEALLPQKNASLTPTATLADAAPIESTEPDVTAGGYPDESDEESK